MREDGRRQRECRSRVGRGAPASGDDATAERAGGFGHLRNGMGRSPSTSLGWYSNPLGGRHGGIAGGGGGRGGAGAMFRGEFRGDVGRRCSVLLFCSSVASPDPATIAMSPDTAAPCYADQTKTKKLSEVQKMSEHLQHMASVSGFRIVGVKCSLFRGLHFLDYLCCNVQEYIVITSKTVYYGSVLIVDTRKKVCLMQRAPPPLYLAHTRNHSLAM